MTSVLLILGMKGSGKTSLGKSLSRRLGLPFADLDELLAERADSPSAREAFLKLGEGGFRVLEARLLGEILRGAAASGAAPGAAASDAARGAALLLSTGGGLCEAPGALGLLSAARNEGRALLLYLEASAALLYARLEAAGALPAWLGAEPSLAAFAAVQEGRAALYRGLDPIRLDASLPPEALLEAALARLYADPIFAILVRGQGRDARSSGPDKENA